MSIETRSLQYGSIFGNWHIEKLLGSGSNGKSAVFSLYRDNNGWREYCALKVVSLIEERGTEADLSERAINEYSTAVRELRNNADLEVRLMKQLSGKTNIVDYLDHSFFSWKDSSGFGVDLLIRMEKLQDIRCEMEKGTFYSIRDILKIAENICQALILCHGKNILHRDIKPENIFFNQDRDYKLGDFGIARIMADSPVSRASTGIGTLAYSAPEQLRGAYDQRVDIYSLGLVLYELLNGNRLPFAQSGYISDREIQLRLSGTPLPEPEVSRIGASLSDPQVESLVGICMKACAYQPQDRYVSAAQLLQALKQLSTGSHATPASVSYETAPTQFDNAGTAFQTQPVENTFSQVSTLKNQTIPVSGKSHNRENSRKPNYTLIISALCGALIIATLGFLLLRHRHTWTDATCTSARYCDECGEVSGSPIGHQWVDASCTTARHCSVCAQTSGSALGHDWMDATCENAKICRRCGLTEESALSHVWIEPTCEHPRTCSLCGSRDGEALGHISSEATFHTPAICSRCNAITGPTIPYHDISIEEAILPVRDHFTDCMNKIARNELKRVILSGGIYSYYDENDQLVMVTVFKKTQGIGSYSDDYTRWYCYLDGEFVYAFYDGEDQHRFSFYDEMLMRWRYRPVLNAPEYDMVYDFNFTAQYLEWERVVLQEALSFK